MEYRIIQKSAPPAEQVNWSEGFWADVQPLAISHFHPKSSAHHPPTHAKLAWTDDALHAIWRVDDHYVLARRMNLNESVCRDSCVELFLGPPEGPGYMNFEINAVGTMLASHVIDPTRPSRHAKMNRIEPIDEQTGLACPRQTTLAGPIDPERVGPITWLVQLAVPWTVFEKFFGPVGSPAGQAWRGNLFKCADESSHPHWAGWAPLAEQLNFHQPDYFATLRFE